MGKGPPNNIPFYIHWMDIDMCHWIRGLAMILLISGIGLRGQSGLFYSLCLLSQHHRWIFHVLLGLLHCDIQVLIA